MKNKWFSSKIRLAYFVENSTKNNYWDSLYLIRAENFEDATKKVLTLGYQKEESYTNANGRIVYVKFKEILTLDYLGESIENKEVLCEISEIPQELNESHNTTFKPDQSAPSQTI